MPRYLTKSRFTLALNCPTKLFYTSKDEYPNKNSENEFLEALAKGGYQVGALAQCYFPDGTDIETLNPDQAIAETEELLKQDNVVIFEAAIQVQGFFIRVDILVKNGDNIKLIEVKSKSFAGNSSLDFLNASGYIDTNWKPYIYDVAFQKHVLQLAKPEWEIKAYLMLADKNKSTSINGLNQKFLFREQKNGRTKIEFVGNISPLALGSQILAQIDVDDLCDRIYKGTDSKEPLPLTFPDYCSYLAEQYWNDQKIISSIHKDCGKCEFKASSEEEAIGKISGFKECFKQQLKWTDQEFQKPSIYDIWDFRRKADMIEQGIFHFDELMPFHIGPDAEVTSAPLIRQGRQWLQIQRTIAKNPDPFLDAAGLNEEMSDWVYPLHMIDFETSAVAIPFYRGMRPYEFVAFQFSHHIIHKDGRIEHLPEYINVERGHFPNFDFVRALKDQLSNDNGSVFRYAAHENTILNHIQMQLQSSNEADKQDLIDFISTITHSANHCGDRDMIDLLNVVKKHYWHPIMGGSNSLKVVLPAILNSSDHIKEKYSKPIYGRNSEIKSQHFDDGWIWIKEDEQGNIISPYALLPQLFDGLDEENVEEFLMGDRLADGGAAMTAYAMIQFTEMSEDERSRIIEGLLKYCELDTLAMVFLWEYFNV